MTSDWPRAFARAAEARDAAVAIIAQVRSGDLTLEQAYARADADTMSGRVFAVKVLEAVPGIGKVRARRTMEMFDVAEDSTLAGISATARAQIADRFTQTPAHPTDA